MELDNLKTGIKGVGLDNIRADNVDYFEAVVKKESIEKIAGTIKSILGEAVWPSQDKLSKDIQKMVDKFGGLRKGQTLFFLSKDGVSLFAMLWPWQDGERITIKIGMIK